MTILNPDHLFDQALRLTERISAGPPRQTDLRRAVSAAYYGIFHFILASVADEFIGVTQRPTSRYGLFYRRVDHRGLRELCTEVRKPVPSARFALYLSEAGFGADMRRFAATALDLQERRHDADYNPMQRLTVSEARFAVDSAVGAVPKFKLADPEERKMFLALLVCPPR